MKESDLHMSDGEVRTPCTSSHCSVRQISCVLFLPKIVAGSNSLRFVAMCWKKLVTRLVEAKGFNKEDVWKKGVLETEREANSITASARAQHATCCTCVPSVAEGP